MKNFSAFIFAVSLLAVPAKFGHAAGYCDFALKNPSAGRPGGAPGAAEAFRRFVDRRDGSFAAKRDEVRGILQNRQVDPGGMSDEEIVAIFIYTDNRYSSLNHALRTGGPGLAEFLPFSEMLSNALSKLPDEKGPVVRGTDLPPDVLRLHQAGQVVEYKAFTSASRDIAFGGQVQLKILSRHGKFIDQFSATKGQNEVLFAPAFFLVKDRIDHADGRVELLLEELESPYRVAFAQDDVTSPADTASPALAPSR